MKQPEKIMQDLKKINEEHWGNKVRFHCRFDFTNPNWVPMHLDYDGIFGRRANLLDFPLNPLCEEESFNEMMSNLIPLVKFLIHNFEIREGLIKEEKKITSLNEYVLEQSLNRPRNKDA